MGSARADEQIADRRRMLVDGRGQRRRTGHFRDSGISDIADQKAEFLRQITIHRPHASNPGAMPCHLA
ncbi:hypothetical protein Acsp03_48110 [Actinomadura sp. NBRC 104412]|nr:hypothetical protein Acsp03_48110 [Actinomadura sp. NBRC 104412]